MIEMTASGVGQREDVDDRRIDVEVHGVSHGIAGATVRCAPQARPAYAESGVPAQITER